MLLGTSPSLGVSPWPQQAMALCADRVPSAAFIACYGGLLGKESETAGVKEGHRAGRAEEAGLRSELLGGI